LKLRWRSRYSGLTAKSDVAMGQNLCHLVTKWVNIVSVTRHWCTVQYPKVTNTETNCTLLSNGDVYARLFVVKCDLLSCTLRNFWQFWYKCCLFVVSNLLTVACGIVFQRLLRLQDAKQVEAKAAKIKEWVTNKLREVG
jgi:hypothetical protein